MSAEVSRKILKWLFLGMGLVVMSAIIPMVMPTDWMESTNDSLGLGPFHRSPLTEYLTRSLSAVYALFGALAVYIALHIERYLDLVVVIGLLTMALGVALLGIDLMAGMPPAWTWGEAPPIIVMGGIFVWLARRSSAQEAGR